MPTASWVIARNARPDRDDRGFHRRRIEQRGQQHREHDVRVDLDGRHGRDERDRCAGNDEQDRGRHSNPGRDPIDDHHTDDQQDHLFQVGHGPLLRVIFVIAGRIADRHIVAAGEGMPASRSAAG